MNTGMCASINLIVARSLLSMSAQAAKLKKVIFETPRPPGLDNYCFKGDRSAKLEVVLF